MLNPIQQNPKLISDQIFLNLFLYFVIKIWRGQSILEQHDKRKGKRKGLTSVILINRTNISKASSRQEKGYTKKPSDGGTNNLIRVTIQKQKNGDDGRKRNTIFTQTNKRKPTLSHWMKSTQARKRIWLSYIDPNSHTHIYIHLRTLECDGTKKFCGNLLKWSWGSNGICMENERCG